MSSLLELIFQGLIEWIYGLILEAWEYFSTALLDIMSMDFSYLESHIAIISTIRRVMLAVGWALLLGNLIFQAIKTMMSGLGFEGEDPKLLFTRTFVFSFLLLASPQICELCLNMTSRIVDLMQMPTAVSIAFANESTFAGLDAAWMLIVICGIIVMFQSFKLIFEMAERYFILAMLTISSPLAFGMGGSRNTSDIFSGWCRMYGSMCLLMFLNVVFLKMLLSVLSYVPSGFDVLPWMVLVLTIVKVAKKADAIITRIGLNPAITGDGLGRSFPGALTMLVARSAISNISRAFARGAPPGSDRAGRPRSGPAPASGAPRNGGNTAGTGARQGRNGGHSHVNAAQASTQQATVQQEAPAQNASTQLGGSYAASTSQSNTTAFSNSHVLQGNTPGNRSGQARQSFVPTAQRGAAARSNSTRGAASTVSSGSAQGTTVRPPTGNTASAGTGRPGTSQSPASFPPNGTAESVQSAGARSTQRPAATEAAALRTAAAPALGAAGKTSTAPRTAGTAEQRHDTAARSTQRPNGSGTGTARPAAVQGHAAPRENPAPRPSDPAGTASTQPGRRSSAETRQSRKPASASTTAPARTGTPQTARQERKSASSQPRPQQKTPAPSSRPGTAGTASQPLRGTQTGQTARTRAASAERSSARAADKPQNDKEPQSICQNHRSARQTDGRGGRADRDTGFL